MFFNRNRFVKIINFMGRKIISANAVFANYQDTKIKT